MSSDVEYLLLKEKGPFHDVCVRRRLNTSPSTCKFYAVVISILVVCMVSLLVSLVYVFVLVPSWQGTVLSWDGRLAVDRQDHAYPEVRDDVCVCVCSLLFRPGHVFVTLTQLSPVAGSYTVRTSSRCHRKRCARVQGHPLCQTTCRRAAMEGTLAYVPLRRHLLVGNLFCYEVWQPMSASRREPQLLGHRWPRRLSVSQHLDSDLGPFGQSTRHGLDTWRLSRVP